MQNKDNILVTGANGFVGRHLTEYLRKQAQKVTTCSRSNSDVNIDLTNLDEVKKCSFSFNKIFHLAAQSSVHVSWERPFETLRYNINSVNNLLETFAGTKTKTIFAGTSEVYKNSNNILTEESELKTENLSPYAISKLCTDQLIRTIAKDKKVNCTLLRLFSHVGPGQSTNFALSSWAKQLVQIKYGAQEKKIYVGNLNVRRDYVSVDDVVRAYDLVSNEECYGEVFNVCSGNAYLMRDLLNKLIEMTNLDVEIVVDEKLVRKNDVEYMCGNHDKITKRFGWEPKIPIETTLRELLFYWEQNACV